jgi:hypothetical protein
MVRKTAVAEIHCSTSSPRETALFNDYDARFRPYLTPLSGGRLTQFRGTGHRAFREIVCGRALASSTTQVIVFNEEGIP